LIDKNAGVGLESLHAALDGGTDPRQFARQLVDHFRGLLLIALGNPEQVDASPDQKQVMQTQCSCTDSRSLVEYIRLFNIAASDSRNAWQPSLSLEMAFAQAVAFSPETAETPVQATIPSYKKDNPSLSKTPQPSYSSQPKQVAAVPLVEKPTPGKPVQAVNPASHPEPSSGQSEDILRQWDKIRSSVKRQRPQTEALLNSCKVRRIQDGVLVLGFDGDLLRSKMETGDNITATQDAIREVTGLDIQIKCTVVSAKAANLPQDMGAEPDGIVSAAVNAGGKIIHKE
jgi:DNA polymerase-3 subunit gamma/tau